MITYFSRQITRECERLGEGLGLTIGSPLTLMKSPAVIRKCDVIVTTPMKLLQKLEEKPCHVNLNRYFNMEANWRESHNVHVSEFIVFCNWHSPPLTSTCIISLCSVEWLIVDECDKMFETGQGFKFRKQVQIFFLLEQLLMTWQTKTL